MNCSFIKENKTRCGANAILGSNYCFSHNPNNKEEKLLAVTKGGQNRRLYGSYGSRLDLETPQDIRKLIGEVINGVWTGTIPATQPANTIGFLSRCFLDAYEMGDMEKRLTILEEKM